MTDNTTTLGVTHVEDKADIACGGAFYNSYNPEEGKFPDSPCGEYSYFYDFYVYNSGLALQSELAANLDSKNGDPMAYLTSVARRSILTSDLDISTEQTWHTAAEPNMASQSLAINAFAPFRGLWHYSQARESH